ncbi:hypothetical protein JG687_00005445 [Phytophthora cactorum]|uniref:Uncharacterized protein n=1 Tax=Phytophthora cactorum TaxID=29920 RepID=A0A8T1UKT8_9STRA|nr:hypothetical protein JG687_00005445 [Phytophthora cactorum]
MRAAKEAVTYLKHNGLSNFDVVPQNNPIQFDQFSCGLSVWWMFLRQIVHEITHDMSGNSLIQRRFELFYYILTGRLIAPIENAAVTAYTQTQPPLLKTILPPQEIEM